MKTASKFLSMLLLVAMCLSLLGGSAFAAGLEPIGGAATLDLVPLDETPADTSVVLPAPGTETTSSDGGLVTLDLGESDPSLLTGAELIWKVTGGSSHETLAEALKEVGNGGTITLCADATIADPVSIAKSITLDLGGKTLTLNAGLITTADVTLKNGAIVFNTDITAQSGVLKIYDITADKAGFVEGTGADVQIYSGKFQNKPADSLLAKDRVWDTSTQEVVPVSDSYVAYVNGKGYTTVDAAFAAANDLGKKDIIIELNSGKLENLTMSSTQLYNCNSLTLKLNDEHLVISDTLTLGNYPATITGYKIEGTVKAEATTLTLGSGLTATRIDALDGASVTVNGATVDVLALTNAALNMASGTIGNLVIADDKTASPLNVSGGTVKGFEAATTVIPVRAITGGEWTLDASDLAYFDGAVANNYERRGETSPYTVARIGSSGSGGSGIVTGSFTLYGSPYVIGSGTAVYIDMPAKTEYKYWVSTNASGYNASALTVGVDCTEAANGTGYRLTLTKSFLDKLSAGTYYFFSQGPKTGDYYTTLSMGALTVQAGSGTVVPGDVAIWPADSSTWYSGDGMKTFYYRPAIDFSDPTSKGLWIDGWLQDPTNWVTNNNSGTLKIGTAILNNLSRGWHTVSINTVNGVASCDFYVGATLRPVDTDKHVIGSSKNLQFVCSDSIQSVYINGRPLTDVDYGDYWTLSYDRKTVTLTAKFLNNRTAGETYSIGVVTTNGDRPSCNFKILTTAQASASPGTGDASNLALWAAVLVLSGGAAVAVLPRLKKHEN